MRRVRDEALVFLELFALTGVAFAMPVLNVLGKNPTLFVAARTTAWEGVLLVAAALLLPSLALLGVENLVGLLSATARRILHIVVCAALVVMAVFEFLRIQTSMLALPAAWLGAAAGAGAAVLLALGRTATVSRRYLHFLAIAPVVSGFLFGAGSPAGDAVFASGGGVAGASTARTPHRVVMVIFDEMPDEALLDGTGHVDAALFPHFAALQHSSTWYRNTTTVAAYTEGAVPALATGQYPARRKVLPIVAGYPRNLFTLLGRSYTLNVHESVTALCPSSLCKERSKESFGSVIKDGLRLWVDATNHHHSHPTTFVDFEQWKHALSDSQEFVKSIQPSATPRLDYLHVQLPHYPWRYLKTFQVHSYVPGDPPGENYLGLWPKAGGQVAHQRQLLQVQAVDTILGQIVGRLQQIGAYRDTMLIITGDHGVAFKTGEPPRNPSAHNLDAIMFPPLFIKYPNQTSGVIDDRPGLNIDVLPTIAQVVGVDVGAKLDGRSLRGAPRADGPRRLYPWTFFKNRKDLPLAPGEKYALVDTKPFFQELLHSRAAVAGSDPDLRIYQTRDFGELVGRDAGPLVLRGSAQPERARWTFPFADPFADVNPTGPIANWDFDVGKLTNVAFGTPIAVAFNGRIGAVSEAVPQASGSRAIAFTFVVPPQLLQKGKNDVSVFRIVKTPSGPRLVPLSHL